jgi:hypothetical protein
MQGFQFTQCGYSHFADLRLSRYANHIANSSNPDVIEVSIRLFLLAILFLAQLALLLLLQLGHNVRSEPTT